MSEDEDRLTLTDVARRAQVRLSAVSNGRARYADFPQASVVSGQELFDEDDIAQWLRSRRIARNRLKPDEPPGTSYGDRFLSRGSDAGSRLVSAADRAARSELSWRPAVRAAMAVLRNTHDPGLALAFLLGLVYVRVRRTDVWRLVAGAADWPTVRGLLAGVSFPVGPANSAIPVFTTLTHAGDESVLDAVRAIDTIDFGGHSAPDSTGARISEAILADLERGLGRSGGHFTPSDVAQCLGAGPALTSTPPRTSPAWRSCCGPPTVSSCPARNLSATGGGGAHRPADVESTRWAAGDCAKGLSNVAVSGHPGPDSPLTSFVDSRFVLVVGL